MSATPVVRLRSLSKSFGETARPVLENVGLVLHAGEKASLVGPSGSGKSTLLSLIAGLLRPDAGTVEIDGVAISELNDRQSAGLRADRIGIALQSDNLIPFLTARENVELALGFGTRKGRSRAMDLLERFHVSHRAGHRPRQLSGGEAQRVALAVSMANEPALLLADEVVAQLDGQLAASVVAEVLDSDCALLFVTHDPVLADLVEHRYALEGHTVVRR